MAAHVCRQRGYKAATVSIMMFFLYIELLYIHVRRQGGYKAATVSIMMFFLYIELLYIQLYHDSSCMSTGRIQSRNGKYYDVLSIYWTTLYPTVSWQLYQDTKQLNILNYFISNCIMSTERIQSRNPCSFYILTTLLNLWQPMYVDREDTKPLKYYDVLYIELLYIQLYHGSSCMSTERIQSRNGKYYDVLSIYWTTLYPTVSCMQLMYKYYDVLSIYWTTLYPTVSTGRIQSRNTKVSIMMFFLYIELLYIQLYHGSLCTSTGRIQSQQHILNYFISNCIMSYVCRYKAAILLWCSFYILNYFISNCIMAAHVCRQGGYKASTVSIMMFFL